MRFSPYRVFTQFFLDPTPPGSYDFTIAQGSNFRPLIPVNDGGEIIFARPLGGYGNYVAIRGDSGFTYVYTHLDRIDVSLGQRLSKFDPIGTQGTTGNSTGEHIHMEVWTRPLADGGSRIVDRAITRPLIEAYIQELRDGNP
ncbi:MAG: M23 family metallopeptidase [Synechococcus sp.]